MAQPFKTFKNDLFHIQWNLLLLVLLPKSIIEYEL